MDLIKDENLPRRRLIKMIKNGKDEMSVPNGGRYIYYNYRRGRGKILIR